VIFSLAWVSASYWREGSAEAETGKLVRAHETGSFHSRTIEKRTAAANKAKTKPLFPIR